MRTAKWFLFFALAGTGVAADRNEVDWVSKTKTCPEMPDKPGPVTFTITNINDFLYTYGIDAKGISRLANIPKFSEPQPTGLRSLSNAAELSTTECQAGLADAESAWGALQAGLADERLAIPAGSKQIIPLSESVVAWQQLNSIREAEIDVFLAAAEKLRDKGCLSLNAGERARRDRIFEHWGRFDALKRRAESNHEATLTVIVSKSSDWIFTISQYNQGIVTATHRWRCGEDDTLTLSLGTLFTSLPNRSYQSRKAPLAPGNSAPAPTGGTGAATNQTILVLENNSSITPLGAALLNFKIPLPASFPYWMGISLSSGPVLKLGGSTAEVSSLGYFAGVSAHLWRGLFFTPGVHVGQFADFPAGFSPGMQIPNNFGELNPVKRWTAKFAFGLTYKTMSFGGGAKQKSADTGAAPAAVPE